MFSRKTLSVFILPLVWIGLTAGAPGTSAPKLEMKPAQDGVPSRAIVLPLNKAVIIDLPADAKDVLVSDPEIVDAVIRTPRRTYLMGNQVGQANAFFFDAAGNQILNLEIRVERDLAALNGMINRFIPDSQINVEAINDNIVLTGSVRNAMLADRARNLAARFVGSPDQVMTMLAIESGEQVLLKVRIVEMQRQVAKQLGVDFDAVIEAGEFVFNPQSRNPFSIEGNPLSTNQIGFFDLNSNEGNDPDAAVRAFERAGIVRTLAEPNLTAISGESANFLAGGEFPVPVSRDRDGNITLEFKPFGVGLGFTPIVLDEGRISLRISTEVSELTSDDAFVFNQGVTTDGDGNVVVVPGTTIPGLTVRRAESTVELPSGGSIVMAGLLSDSTKQNIDGIPGVKDMPVIGALARSRDFQSNQTELVIIVTPYLAGPVNEKQLATPLDGHLPPSDADTILFGRLNSVYGKGKEIPNRKLQGPHGYIVR